MTLMLGGIGGRRRRGRLRMRWLDGSLTLWTWVWVNSRSWWWTGRPSVLQFMGSQRARHDWVTFTFFQSNLRAWTWPSYIPPPTSSRCNCVLKNSCISPTLTIFLITDLHKCDFDACLILNDWFIEYLSLCRPKQPFFSIPMCEIFLQRTVHGSVLC